MGFLCGSDNKESTYDVGNLGSIPRLGRNPGEGNGNPLQYSRLENPHGQRRLVAYPVHGVAKSHTTEGLTLPCITESLCCRAVISTTL